MRMKKMISKLIAATVVTAMLCPGVVFAETLEELSDDNEMYEIEGEELLFEDADESTWQNDDAGAGQSDDAVDGESEEKDAVVLTVDGDGANNRTDKFDPEITHLKTNEIDYPDVGVVSQPWIGNYVYYGKYNNDPVLYRILDPDTNTNAPQADTGCNFGITEGSLLLDCDSVLAGLYPVKYSVIAAKPWTESLVRKKLNGDEFFKNDSNFSKAERSAIPVSKKERKTEDFDGDGDYCVDNVINRYDTSFSALNDNIFVLDDSEAENRFYGYYKEPYSINSCPSRLKERVDNGNLMGYLLRSPLKNSVEGFTYVGPGTGNVCGKVENNNLDVSPAFNVSLNNIIFSTKVDTRTVIYQNESYDRSIYKLTLLDTDLSAELQNGHGIYNIGDKYYVPFKVGGIYDCVSVLITGINGDGIEQIVLYKKLDIEGEISKDGTGTGSLTMTEEEKRILGRLIDCKLTVMAEKLNDDKYTDYAGTSAPREVNEEIAQGYKVMVEPSANGSAKADHSIAAAGETVKLTYEAAKGYHLKGWETNPNVKIADDGTFTMPEGDVTVKAVFEEDPEFDVTVKKEGKGTVSVNTKKAKAGTVIQLKATPALGYTFSKWKTSKVTLKSKDKTKSGVSFDMPADNVTVTAVFKKIDVYPFASITSKGKDKLVFKWKTVKYADGYELMLSRCNHEGKEYKPKCVKTIWGNKVTEWTVTGLEKGKSYKGYVRAFVCSSKKGKRVYIGWGPLVHEYTSGGTKTMSDARKLTVESTDITLEKGDTYKIKAKITKRDKKKKLFGHVDKFRYKSTNKNIASVSDDGKIKGVKAGKCYVYAYAHDGVHKRIKVTVKTE